MRHETWDPSHTSPLRRTLTLYGVQNNSTPEGNKPSPFRTEVPFSEGQILTTSGMFATSSKVDWKPRLLQGRGFPIMARYSCSSSAGVKPPLAAISRDLTSFFSTSRTCACFAISTLKGKQQQAGNNSPHGSSNTGKALFSPHQLKGGGGEGSEAGSLPAAPQRPQHVLNGIPGPQLSPPALVAYSHGITAHTGTASPEFGSPLNPPSRAGPLQTLPLQRPFSP